MKEIEKMQLEEQLDPTSPEAEATNPRSREALN